MDGTGDLFRPLVSALPDTITPIVVRYPATEELGYDDLTIIAREAIPKDQPYAILGESFSGPIAISIASGAESDLSALFLSCSFARNPSKTLAALNPILSFIPVRSMLADFAAKYLLGAHSAELKGSVQESLDRVEAKVLRKRLRELVLVDSTHDLQNVTAPIQYLQASNDWLVPKKCAQQICDAVPSTEIFLIDGPHLLLQREPERAARAIAGFLDKNAAV